MCACVRVCVRCTIAVTTRVNIVISLRAVCVAICTISATTHTHTHTHSLIITRWCARVLTHPCNYNDYIYVCVRACSCTHAYATRLCKCVRVYTHNKLDKPSFLVFWVRCACVCVCAVLDGVQQTARVHIQVPAPARVSICTNYTANSGDAARCGSSASAYAPPPPPSELARTHTHQRSVLHANARDKIIANSFIALN